MRMELKYSNAHLTASDEGPQTMKFRFENPVMIKRSLRTAGLRDCADSADRADWKIFDFLILKVSFAFD